MTRVLALIGIIALLWFFQIPQRIPWQELRGFKGADAVEKAAQPFLIPSDRPTPKDESWMAIGCQPGTIHTESRLSQSEYQRHLSANDFNTPDPLKSKPPFCLHQDQSQVWIPEWLSDSPSGRLRQRRYRLRIYPNGNDSVEQIPP